MRAKLPILVLILGLTLLTVLPTATINVHAASTGTATWSPFGPREKNLIITDYGDIASEATAFNNGGVDIADYPFHVCVDIACSSDFYSTPPISELDIFQLDINHLQSFLGVPLQTTRSPPSPTFVLPAATTSSSCGSPLGQLTINLQNQEQGNAPVLDSVNSLTISLQPGGGASATVGDSGGMNPTGTYNFPCVPLGTYKVTSSIYGTSSPCSTTSPTSCIAIGGGQLVTATFRADWNSPSTKQPTNAGFYIGRALAHLIDKPSFIATSPFLRGAQYDDIQAAPNQNVPNLFPLTQECTDHSWFNPCSPVSAYNFVADNIGGGSVWWGAVGAFFGATGGYSGYADMRAACDDFVKAGFAVVNGANATDCGGVALASEGTTAPSSYAHLANNGNQLLFFLSSSQFRKAFGQIIADSLNFLFGTPNNGGTIPNQTPQCTVLYITLAGGNCNIPTGIISPSPSCIFDATCAWNMYTGARAVGTGPDLLYFLYDSSTASSVCGGPSTKSALYNYGFYCDPQFDTFAFAGEFTATTITGLTQFFAQAAETGALNGMTVPFISPTSQFVALNGWNFQQCTGIGCVATQSSLVPTFGHGFFPDSGYWSLLNMRQVPGYTPSNSIYRPGGGNPDLIRRGWWGGTTELNPFGPQSVWDSELISLIYESMLQTNPLTGGVVDGQIVDWQTTGHSSSFNPSEVSCNAVKGCFTGTTTTLWHLRNDVTFQDGTPLTASDVVYTILSYRDVPSNSFQGTVGSVTSAVTIDPLTVQVKFQGPNPLEVIELGQLPIIPEHIWEPICGPIVNGAIPGGPTSQCANPSFDPMAQGIMIGSGPWKCVVPAGFPNAGYVGGSCVVSAGVLGGQIMSGGSQVLLTRNTGYMRCCPDDPTSNLYKFSYADFNNLGRVDIVDIASVASRFGQPDPYWVNSNIAPGTTVNIEDVAVVAFYFGNGITRPFTPSQLTGLDPQIDPFFCLNTGC